MNTAIAILITTFVLSSIALAAAVAWIVDKLETHDD